MLSNSESVASFKDVVFFPDLKHGSIEVEIDVWVVSIARSEQVAIFDLVIFADRVKEVVHQWFIPQGGNKNVLNGGIKDGVDTITTEYSLWVSRIVENQVMILTDYKAGVGHSPEKVSF